LARDDFAICPSPDMGCFYVFGGFVRGSRVDDCIKFTAEGGKLEGEVIQHAEGATRIPIRASTSAVVHDSKLWVFGGQDDDNNKLSDLWCCDMGTKTWSQVEIKEGDHCPCARSGHTAVMWNDKMYIFGGIFELTKELGDLNSFDFKTKQFACCENDNNATAAMQAEQQVQSNAMAMEESENASPLRRGPTIGNKSPLRQATLRKQGTLASVTSGSQSPMKKKTVIQTAAATGEEPTEKAQLSSPTSYSMQNSFIIKNADESFDVYYSKMRRRRQAAHGMGMADATMEGGANASQMNLKSGFFHGSRPTPRDGHTACVDSLGNMWVFGGDRHQMPFNDLYMIKLD